MTHTPTPWRVEEGTTLIWGKCDPDDMTTWGMGYPVVDVRLQSRWGERPDTDETDANAAFIVRAVNSHDALIAALNGLLFNYDPEACAIPVEPDPGCIECTSGVTPNDMNTGPCSLHRAYTALAQARGEGL